MKKIIFILLILIGGPVLCQTNYSFGFSEGYKVGYCYNQGIGCIAPIPPITPLCRIGESAESYFDGYNRGLLMGTTAGLVNSSSQLNSNSTAVYGQPKDIPKIEPFKPDYAFYEKVLKQSQSNYEQSITNSKTQKEKERQGYTIPVEMRKMADEYFSPENAARREAYVKFLKQYYLDLKIYPRSIPDGLYKVTFTTEPQYGQENLGTSFREGEAWVINNKVVFTKTLNEFRGGDSFMKSVDKFPEVKEEDGGLGITNSYSISNGKGEIRYKLFFSGECVSNYMGTIQTIYFIDYISQYQNAQKCIDEIKKKHASLKNYPKVQDGWNIVYANDGEGVCDVRHVFVENGEITL